MPRRRKGAAPQTEVEVLSARLDKLQREVDALRQPGPSSLQADDYEKALDPVPWQTIIHHKGTHTAADPSDPMVYYHPGDDVVPAGFKKVTAVAPAATHYMPFVDISSIGGTLAESTGPPYATRGMNFTSLTLLTIYDFANVNSRVFDISGSLLPSDNLLGIKKRGLYLCCVHMVWQPSWGKITRVGLYAGVGEYQPLHGMSHSSHGHYIPEMGEPGDDGTNPVQVTAIENSMLLRKYNEIETTWVRVQGRHRTGATRDPNIFLSVVRLSSNPGDNTDFGSKYTIPG